MDVLVMLDSSRQASMLRMMVACKPVTCFVPPLKREAGMPDLIFFIILKEVLCDWLEEPRQDHDKRDLKPMQVLRQCQSKIQKATLWSRRSLHQLGRGP